MEITLADGSELTCDQVVTLQYGVVSRQANQVSPGGFEHVLRVVETLH